MIDLLRATLFESIVLLALVEAVALAVVVAMYRRNPSPGRQHAVWITVVMCMLLLGVQHFVQTDREKIEAAVRAMATAVDDGDMAALGEHLDRDFQDRGLNKQDWLAEVRQRLQRWQLDQVKVAGFNIDVDGDQAVASFRASCDWRGPQQTQQGIFTAWKLGFIRRDDGWKLQRIISANGLGGILDYAQMLKS